jgi:TatD DNase family protein
MLIDSHCHLDRLDLSPYGGNLSGALQAAHERGVGLLLCIGISQDNFGQVFDIASNYHHVYATAGLHPLEFNEPDHLPVDKIASWLRRVAGHPLVLGIGETGLDYYYSKVSIDQQRESFAIHLKVAKDLAKPVVVHSRDAREDTLALVHEHGCRESAGVLHCFTENWDMAKAALDMGYYISFSGIITFKNAAELRQVVKRVPMDRLLVETDSPYLAPIPFRGKPNEPKNVVEVARCVAELKQIPFEQVCEQTSRNFLTLFRIKPPEVNCD